MSKPPFTTLERVVHELILPLYAISRATSLPRQFNRHENDAEHSWGLALLTCALAPHIDPKLDVGKICQFAVIHDLVEVYAGDTPNYTTDEEKASKDDREHAAFEKLKLEFSDLPWISETISEYEAQNTPEAKFVRSLDKTLALMQDYESQGQNLRDYRVTAELFKIKLREHRKKAEAHDSVFEYYEAAEKRLLDNPQWFHKERN